MTFLPAVLLRGKQNVMDLRYAPHKSYRARMERVWLDRPVAVVVIVLLISAASVIPARRVFFDYNLLHLQSEGLPAVEYEHKLINSASKSVLFAAVVAPSREEAIILEAKLTNLPSVATVDSMAKYLVGDQRRKLEKIGEIKREVADIRFATVDPESVKVDDLSRTLWALHGYLGLALEEVAKEGATEVREKPACFA